MKEVKFRWIDKYLIQTTIRAKFIILASISIFTLLLLSFILNQKYTELAKTTQLQNSIANVSQQNSLIDKAIRFIPKSAQVSFFADVSSELQIRLLSELTLKQQQIALNGGGVLATQVISSVSPNDRVSIRTLKLNSLMTEESDDLSLFSYGVTSALILLVIISIYYVSTFIRGALYTTVQALKQAADGDLTSRLNFFLVKDEFSTLAISIDTLVDRQHQLVKQVVNATTQIRSVVAEFRSNAQ